MQKKHLVVIVKVCALLVCLPFLMGQQGCPTEFVEMMEQYLGPGGKISPKSALYVTSLTFMDAVTKTTMINTETADLINKAVLQGIHVAKKSNDNIKHNEAGHVIPDNDTNAQKLIEITFHPHKTGEEKVSQIISDMMTPNNVDVIVSGQYIDSGQTIQVRPYTIDKRNKNIVSREATFAKESFVCNDPQNASVKILCENAHEEIANIVKELLDAL